MPEMKDHNDKTKSLLSFHRTDSCTVIEEDNVLQWNSYLNLLINLFRMKSQNLMSHGDSKNYNKTRTIQRMNLTILLNTFMKFKT